MKAARARRAEILRHIGDGIHGADVLAGKLGVSLSTIRRDLAFLSQNGALLRTYGGAALTGSLSAEQPLAERMREKAAQKRAIAREASAIIEANETIILDAGTTTGALAEMLRNRSGLCIVTNGLTSLQALAGAEGIELVSVGGTLRPLSLGFAGSLAELTMRRITASRVFLGADGVVAGRGLCEASAEQAALKELMIAQSEMVYVLATADKLGRAASRAWTPLDRPWTLLTDSDATEEQLSPFRMLGNVTIVQAGLCAKTMSVLATTR